MATKTPTFKPPKNLAAAADQLYNTRNQRLALERQAEELQKQETALREHIIANLPKSSATGIAGKLVRVSVENKEVYTVKNWDKYHAYILKAAAKDPGAWSLMNKAANTAGLKAVWESGIKVPGTEKVLVPTLSMNKVGS
jgi:hypothetical protein